jgi:hypothetical protein
MGLSRLENFLKNARGNILYVSPNDLDSTDSIENKGNSLTRPFKTIQRALIEASRFSYQRGLNNDRFNQTTILLYPGDHIVDNRPGWIPDGISNFKLRDGTTSNDFTPWDLTTVYDLTNANNALYKLNSIRGGVIVPRGTSIVGLDLRKTKIRPKYVPNPVNDNIERAAVFRVTGGCYFWQFSMLDADPNGECYKDYTANTFVPNFSHHKLTCFEYADGTNGVDIKDNFQTYSTTRTDLDMYYEKVGLVYGTASGREIQPDYPSSGIDIQPKVDEYRIVGSTGESVGITSIRAGNGITATPVITVTTASEVDGLDVDTPIRIQGITVAGYNGQFVVSEKVNATQFKYEVQNAPINPLPSATGATIQLQSDTVTSASPYIFNTSLRSVFGMNGLHADGNKATGFKSMVVAQFTGIGLQKDDNAFVKYNTTTGAYDDSTVPGNETLSNNSRSIFKPEYANFHIKASNNGFIQCVSIFAIGYAEHFVAETGGDMSITNSNSNFGAKALIASGFRETAFPQDDVGYITHIIPPKEVPIAENAIEFDAIDIEKTIGITTTSERLYLYNQTNRDVRPENVLEGYRVGARDQDKLYVLIPSGGTSVQYSSRIVMPNSQSSSEKIFNVDRSASGINSITSNILTLTQAHSFENAESVRVLSDDGSLPDGLESNNVYYAITNSNTNSGLTTNVNIKLAKTQTDAQNANALSINNLGGSLKIVSRVSDKNSGDIGHPVQYDSTLGQWYVKVSTASTDNQIYNTVVVGLGTTSLGSATPRTFIRRKSDTRSAVDTTYRVRYVIPASSGGSVARPPSDGFIIQESNTSIGSTSTEIQTYFGSGSLSNVNQQRNFRFIANAHWSSNTANILTDLPHDLKVGSQIELVNVKSGLNTTGVGNSGFNGIFQVTGITSAREFVVGINTDPGAFQNDLLTRDTNLPYFKRKRYENVYYIQNRQEVQPYVSGSQDGIYYLTVLNSSVKPSVSPFNTDNFSQPLENLYPQVNRDTPVSDADPSISFALPDPIGQVVVNDVRNSITKETINKFVSDLDVGIGLTNIVTSVGGTVHLIHSAIDHGLNRITQVSIANSGAGYGTGVNGNYYNAKLVGIGTSTTGAHATAKVTVDATGGITNVVIMDGGSAYGIGNTMHVVGIATTTGHSPAVVRVTGIYDNVGDVIRIAGVTSNTYKPYNSIYRITNVQVGASKSFVVVSDSAITGVSTSGIGSSPLLSSVAYLTGEALRINTFTFDPASGIATVVTSNAHGLKVNNKIKISTGIATMPIFNNDFIVKQSVNLNTFTINVGAAATTSRVATASSMFALRGGVTSNDGSVTIEDESLNGRMVPTYAGITTTLSSPISDAVTTDVRLTNVANLGIQIGDYLAIDDEIVRVKTTPTNPATNPLTVFRAVLGTRGTSHDTGSVVRKVKPYPIELRRHSINRASGHTWEYVGYGPGNYSTALPDKQDRSISATEELLAQTTRKGGGVNFLTGMNDRGIAYSGNKKLSTVTGQEEVFDTPIRTVTGEDISAKGSVNLVSATEATFSQSIRVDGGDEGKAISEFTGPVVFTNKVTSSSARGIEASSIFIQGDSTVARKYTVGISTPVNAGTPGDVIYYENPEQGKYLGWVYTLNKDWRRFGNVSLSKDSNVYLFDQVGIASTTLGTSVLRVGAGSSLFVVDQDGVGIGTTPNGKKLRVVGGPSADNIVALDGNVSVAGTVRAGYFIGDGQGLTNLNATATGWGQVEAGLGTGIYNVALSNVGVGTTVPHYNLHLGHPGLGRTALYVQNGAIFNSSLNAAHINVSGALTATTYRFDSSGSNIRAGIVTTSTLVVGTSGTVITTTSSQLVGIGTVSPRAKLDIEGSVKFKTYSENVEGLTISGGNVNIDLQKAQTFNLNVVDTVSQFTVLNPPTGSTTFTIKITQGSTPYSVGIDTFKNSGGSPITVYWAGGGVLPVVTQVANKTDIYSFKTFDGGTSFFGIVGGQNFA